jgi:hypothetical protein
LKNTTLVGSEVGISYRLKRKEQRSKSWRIISDYAHYRKHLLGTLMGALDDNWLGYEQLMILESPPVKDLLPPQDSAV